MRHYCKLFSAEIFIWHTLFVDFFLLIVVVICQFGLLRFWRGADRKEEKDRDGESQVTQGQGQEHTTSLCLKDICSRRGEKAEQGSRCGWGSVSLTQEVTTLAQLGCSVHGFLAPWITLKYALSQVTVHSHTGNCVQSGKLFGLWGRGLMTPEMQAK